MTSFAITVEPAPQPRLAAMVALFHTLAAATPWLARCPPLLAAGLGVAALAGLLATLARVPGRHCALARLTMDSAGCRVGLASERSWQAATLGPGTRVYASWVVLDLAVDRRRLGWLLPRSALPQAEFRRLKALIRLAC